jgi:predicted Zn-dependent protease
MTRGLSILLLLALVGACSPARPPGQGGPVGAPSAAAPAELPSTRTFTEVARRVEPVARQACEARQPRGSCKFVILIDERADQPVNAFQTVDRRGRPILVFTRAIVEEFRNRDEMAFVLSHEAAHHIEDHLSQRAEAAGALAAALEAAAAAGGSPITGQQTASEIGQFLGARAFSKQFELEADALGTLIAKRAGFDPVRGAQFFTRLPDPGDQFLGTHPPNAERIRLVRDIAAQVQ